LLTPRSRVLLEKVTGSAASQEIPRIFGTWRFITVLTSALHEKTSTPLKMYATVTNEKHSNFIEEKWSDSK